jgi:hypothetical protein
MAVEKWIAGATAGWASAFGVELKSIVNGNAILSATSIVNDTNLDIFADLSYIAGATATTVAPAFLGFFLYPLNEDGSTYGDGRFGSSAAGPPPSNYGIGTIGFNAAASTTIAGMVQRIILPPGTFKFVCWNQSGATLDATGPTCKYRTYNRSIA